MIKNKIIGHSRSHSKKEHLIGVNKDIFMSIQQELKELKEEKKNKKNQTLFIYFIQSKSGKNSQTMRLKRWMILAVWNFGENGSHLSLRLFGFLSIKE